jgi:hypothetical protein
MPRPLRIEYIGARYHFIGRGDWREAIFLDDRDRAEFLLHVRPNLSGNRLAGRSSGLLLG